MMRLSTMSDIVLACRLQSEPPLADALASLWFPDHGPLEFIRISANCVFRFESDGEVLFLRFNSSRERELEQLQAEIELVRYLDASGLRVAAPVPSLNGSYICCMDSSAGPLYASVFQGLPGRTCCEVTELSPEMLAAWGHALGQIHQTAKGYGNAGPRRSWREDLRLIETYLPKCEHAAHKELDRVAQALGRLPMNDRNYGIIHYDFELDNVVWDGDTPGSLDYDDCAFHWYVADIAFALRDLFGDRADRVDFQSEPYLLFIEGYRAAHDIEIEDLRLIPLFLRLHNLAVFAKLGRTLEDGEKPLEPTWMDGLRSKLLGKLQSYREAFAAYAGME